VPSVMGCGCRRLVCRRISGINSIVGICDEDDRDGNEDGDEN